MNRIFEVNFSKFISEVFDSTRQRFLEHEHLTIAREEAKKYVEERKLIPFWVREQIVYENLSSFQDAVLKTIRRKEDTK